MNHYWMHSPEIYCHVAVLDEAGKLDLNYSNEPTLERLLGNIGVDPRLSVLLAKSIMKWRGQENSPGAVSWRNPGSFVLWKNFCWSKE